MKTLPLFILIKTLKTLRLSSLSLSEKCLKQENQQENNHAPTTLRRQKYLHYSIVLNILARLSVKSLIRFRCVSSPPTYISITLIVVIILLTCPGMRALLLLLIPTDQSLRFIAIMMGLIKFSSLKFPQGFRLIKLT